MKGHACLVLNAFKGHPCVVINAFLGLPQKWDFIKERRMKAELHEIIKMSPLIRKKEMFAHPSPTC